MCYSKAVYKYKQYVLFEIYNLNNEKFSYAEQSNFYCFDIKPDKIILI